MFAITERLFLRPFWPEDAESLAAKIGVPEVCLNLAAPPYPYRVSDALAKVSIDWASWPLDVSCGIFLRTPDGPALAGGVALARQSDRADEAEIGYWLAREFWGRGIAVEAARPVVENAFVALRLQRLVAGPFIDNPASGRVLQKLGFRKTGDISICESVPRGCKVSSVDYELTREDWERTAFRADPRGPGRSGDVAALQAA